MYLWHPNTAQNQFQIWRFCFVLFLMASRIVRGQTAESLLLHNVTFCREHLAEWQTAARCPVPQFSGKEPSVRMSPGAFKNSCRHS